MITKEKLEVAPYEDTPMRICGPHIMVAWVNDGEGFSGDYNPEDPEDINLLRFDVYYRAKETDPWEAVDDASYCTLMPADTDRETLNRAIKVLYREYCNVLEADPSQSVKKLGEKLSWLCPEDFQTA